MSKFPNDVDAFINPHSNRSFSSPSDSDDNVKGEEFDVGEGPPPLFDRLVVGLVSTLPSSTFFNVGVDVDVDVDVVVVSVVVVLVVVVVVDGEEDFRSTGGRGSLKTKPPPSPSSRARENNRRPLRRLVAVRAGGRRRDDMTTVVMEPLMAALAMQAQRRRMSEQRISLFASLNTSVLFALGQDPLFSPSHCRMSEFTVSVRPSEQRDDGGGARHINRERREEEAPGQREGVSHEKASCHRRVGRKEEGRGSPVNCLNRSDLIGNFTMAAAPKSAHGVPTHGHVIR